MLKFADWFAVAWATDEEKAMVFAVKLPAHTSVKSNKARGAASATRAADWPRLAEAWGSHGYPPALVEACGKRVALRLRGRYLHHRRTTTCDACVHVNT